MRMLIASGLVLAASVVPLMAQKPSVKKFGAACGASVSHQGSPALGKSFTLVYTGPKTKGRTSATAWFDQPILVLGVSSKSAGALKLPWRLPPIENYRVRGSNKPVTTWGTNPCFLRVSPDVVSPMKLVGSTYVSTVKWPVPNDTRLLGVRFYGQWARHSFSSLSNKGTRSYSYVTGLHSSEALEITIGK